MFNNKEDEPKVNKIEELDNKIEDIIARIESIEWICVNIWNVFKIMYKF